MAVSEHSYDPRRSVVVSNFPPDVGEDELTIHFQKPKNGGGDVDKVVVDGNVAFVIFDSPEDAKSVLKKAKETPLQLGGNVLKVSLAVEPTHDQSILLVNNLNPKTSKETLKDFIEATKNADVFQVIFGKHRKAIVILKNEIDEDYSDSKSEELEGFVVSLEFARLTKAIRISNIPQGTSSDAIKFKFSNPKTDGSKVVNMRFDEDNGVAIIYFEEPSAVSTLVKKEHTLENASLIAVPYYGEFKFDELLTKDEQQIDITNETKEFQWRWEPDHLVMGYVLTHEEIESKFDLKRMEYDKETSQLHFTKDFDDPKLAAQFGNKLDEFFSSFVKEDVKIPKGVFDKVKEAIEDNRDEFKVDFSFDGSRVIFVGKKDDVDGKKQLVETMVDRFTEEGQKQSTDFVLEDKNKLKFLNFIDYFADLTKEFSDVKIHGADGASGKLSLLGTEKRIKDVLLQIEQDMMRISEIDFKTSVHQLNFLQRTECRIVNAELKKHDAMLLLINVDGVVPPKALEAKIMTFRKRDDKEKVRLREVVDAKTSEKCIKVDQETATFLSKSTKLQQFKKEQFEKHEVLIDLKLTEPRDIWIVCEKSKVDNAEQELTSLIDENKITSSKFNSIDPMKVCFLKQHYWEEIKEKEKSFMAEGVVVQEVNADLEIKGTKAGRYDMIIFLTILAAKVDCKTYSLNEPGIKKQMSMDTTDAIISDVEKNHKCVITETDMIMQEDTLVEDTETFADLDDTNGSSIMNLPYQFISSVNDKEIKLTSGQKIAIEVGDLAQQTVDVIVNTTNDKVDMNANPCGKALLKVAGVDLENECTKLGSLKTGGIVSSGSGKLNCKRVYHVRSSSWNNGDGALTLRQIIKKCFKQLDKDKLKSIAIPAIGTGTLEFPREQVVKVFFEEVTSYLTTHPRSSINDVRFVAYDKDKATVAAFRGAVKEIKSIKSRHERKFTPIFSHHAAKYNFNLGRAKLKNIFYPKKKDSALATTSGAGDKEISFQIYFDDRGKIDKAWEEFERKMSQYIQERTISDDIIKNFTDRDVQELSKLERDYDFEIKVDQDKRKITFKGHILDIPNVQEKINEILKGIKDNDSKVPSYWVKTTDKGTFHKFKLSTTSKEYKDVEAKFRKTASNQIVSIERIQNNEIYKLFNIKRKAMMKKYRYNLSKKEKMLFHGTSHKNLEKINAGGLNRSYAGMNATLFGRGVYFARHASYSCRETYSPPDTDGLRYMYYARVLIGEYTSGDSSMIVPPSKNSSDPNERFDSVVNNTKKPTIYVMFQDYEYYTEYLITFK